jgi:hypothetical protein
LCVWYEVQVQFYSFAGQRSFFPSPFVEMTVLPLLNDSGTILKDEPSDGLFLGWLVCGVHKQK